MTPLPANKSFCPHVLYGHGPCEEQSCPRVHDVRLCEQCVVICSPSTNYESHIRGRLHRENAAKTLPPRHVKADVIRCPPCGVVVSASTFGSHCTTELHRRREELASRRTAYELAENDKLGVSLSHAEEGVNFGVVNLEQASLEAGRIELSLSSRDSVVLARTWIRARVPNHASA